MNRAWIIRGLAYAVDVGVLYLVGLPMGLASGLLLRIALSAVGLAWEFGGQTNWVAGLIIGLIASTVYFALFEWLFGATPGKLLLRQRVVQADGSPCRLWPALARGLLRLIDSLVFGAVAYTEMKRTLLQQRLGDRLGRTLVVSSRDPFIRRRRPWLGLILATAIFLPLNLVGNGGVLLLSGAVVPRNQGYAQMPASDLNLALAEVGSELTLQAEGPLRLSSGNIRETNERLFVTPGIAVKSRVLVFNVYLADQESDLAGFAQTWAGQEVKTAQGFRPSGKTSCADRASFQAFSSSDGRQGYVLALVERNVLVSVLSFGPPEKIRAEDVQTWACTIAARIQ